MAAETWRKLITAEFERRGESWADVIACTLTDVELDTEFDGGFGPVEGKPFTLWTHRRVYFPVQYDGDERAASAPREPCDEAMKHVG